MNELSKVVNAQLQQAAENLVRNRLMSDEFLDFVQENTKPLDTLMAYYKCAIMEVETKFKVLNEQFSLEYDRNPIDQDTCEIAGRNRAQSAPEKYSVDAFGD